MKLEQFARKHPLVSYFVLAYGITWTSLFLFIAARGFRTDGLELSDILVMFFMMAAGPSTSSIVLNIWFNGARGVTDLFKGMLVWRVSIRWYAIALLTIPIVTLAILYGLTFLVSPIFAPGFLGLGIVAGVLAGFIEELGWTGFALPLLLKRHTALKAGLTLGILWALWHMLADYIGNSNAMGSSWFPHFVIYWLVPLTAYRILMTWVYANTKSLLLAQLMHMSYTGWQAVLSPATNMEAGLQWQAIFAGVLCLLVAFVVVTYGARLVRQRMPLATMASPTR